MLTFDDLAIPDDWPLLVGVDTGTYMSATITAFSSDPYAAFVLYEQPNYRYVGGEIELLDMSNVEWARSVHRAYNVLRPNTTKVHGWVDENTQFRTELARYGLALHGNSRKLELRVEIAREYIQAKDPVRFFMAPWLTVLPYEMEHAHWPDQETTAGKYVRVKQDDHTLDTVEHVLSRRPRARRVIDKGQESFIEQYLREHRRPRFTTGDVHLGIHR